ncbi:MAG: hypothetical protein MUP98_09420 [Candidatus Aminicenantes bacterium]|nr:hypothetical protein [Candidatus Aminicenantes bacterium]
MMRNPSESTEDHRGVARRHPCPSEENPLKKIIMLRNMFDEDGEGCAGASLGKTQSDFEDCLQAIALV